MIRVFPPPGFYQAGHCTHDHDPTSSSSVTLGSEGTLSVSSFLGSTTSDGGDPLWSSTSSFLYESSLVTVTLGRRMWGLTQPAYGFNGFVQGAIKLGRKCTHVVRVEVSVETAFRSPRGALLTAVVFFNSSWEEPK
jgi:hypothetical protein